jgi:indolepyruvate ferredoxin oxidoreductase beta subunit
MEAGRAIMRGFVTPDRTTLIASTHRALAVSEKTVPGDGIANSEEVLAAAEIAAQRLIAFDMEKIAIESGTVISASLFGALAGSGELPFPRDSFENAIRSSGRGVEPSLKAFSRAFEAAQAGRKELPAQPQGRSQAQPLESGGAARPVGPERLLNQWDALVRRVGALPAPANPMALRGLRAVVDFQDLAYGAEYIEKLEEIARHDRADKDFVLTIEAAKYLAKALTYDDVIRVADLKTRGSRFERVRREIRPAKDTRMMLTEFMHPRAEEIVGLFPARIGKRFQQNSRAMRLLDRLVNRGRRLRTDRLLP